VFALYIQQYLQWKNKEIWLNGQAYLQSEETSALAIAVAAYKKTTVSYPKFFKMDMLSKVAFVAASIVLPEPITANSNHVAVVISSKSGCLEVDKKFDESRADIASPALFVYTLPNIMLGEICIAKGFKGEQMCTLSPEPDAAWLAFYVNDLLQNRGTEAVLCGHAEATEHGIEAVLVWVNKEPSALPFHQQNLKTIFSKIQS
jgi:hypothetical protein